MHESIIQYSTILCTHITKRREPSGNLQDSEPVFKVDRWWGCPR